jgi:hypothetical protein
MRTALSMSSGVSVAAPIANIWSTSSGFARKPRTVELAYFNLTAFGRGRTGPFLLGSGILLSQYNLC